MQRPVESAYCLLIDQHGIDDTANFDQLLPLATVARESRNLASGNRANASKTDLCHHPFETRACLRAGCRAAQILINYFNLVPAQLVQTIPHRVLQFLALQIVADLVLAVL